jgi:hypothetical protein
MEDKFMLLQTICDDLQFLKQNLKSQASQAISDSPYLDIKQTVEFLKVSKSQVEKISADRIIPVYKPAGKVYFLKSDLLKYIEGGRMKSISELTEEQFNFTKSKKIKS